MMGKTSINLFLHRKGNGKVPQKKGDTTPQPMPCTQAQRRKVMVFEWCGCKRHGKWKNDATNYTTSCTRTSRRKEQHSQLVLCTQAQRRKKQHHDHHHTYKANKRGGNNTMINTKHKGKGKNKQKNCGAWQRFGFLLNSKDTCDV